MFVDSHCHLEMESYDKDRDEVVERSINEGLAYLLTVGTEEKYFKKVVEIVERYDRVYGAIGIHPHESTSYTEKTAATIKQYLTHPKIVGYGEIGLDFFKNYSPREAQIKAFREQLAFAKSLGFPVIVHSRSAKEETLRMLKDAYGNEASGVIHCYSYDWETAKKFLDMGFYISIPGTITYASAKESVEVVRNVPLDRLLAETDAPFLTPVPHRGKRNEPSFVKLTIKKISEIKNMGAEDVASSLQDNFLRAFPKIRYCQKFPEKVE
jgi:TatD DNase family protein